MRPFDAILALGLVPWFVFMDTRRFHTWLAAEALWAYVTRPQVEVFPPTDLERWVCFMDLFRGYIDQAISVQFK